MPKFNIEAEFALYTEVEPDIYGSFLSGGDAENIEDNSSFSTGTVEVGGGNVTFTVEAMDEADAERKAEEVIAEGFEVEDSNGLTWGVQNVSFSIEKNELSREAAFAIIRRLLNRLSEVGALSDEEREALDVILQDM